MAGPLLRWALLTWSATTAQFAQDTKKYLEVLESETALLEEQLKSNEFIEEIPYPERATAVEESESGITTRTVFFNPDVFHYETPHPQLYTIGVLVDPCKGSVPDCCVNQFGSPVYGRIKRDLVDLGYRGQGYRGQSEDFYNPLLIAGSDEILANVDLVDAEGGDVHSDQLRRADDETFIAEECEAQYQGLGRSRVERPYRLLPNGKLVKDDAYTYCQGSRLGHRPYPTAPACMDNNATVDATADCTDLAGVTRPNCMQVAVTQTAVIVGCGKSASRNEKDWSEDPHCGTFLEVHREGGSPYDPDETMILSEQRIQEETTSGYTTTTIDLTYGMNETKKILCNYEEASIRVGSMVFVKDTAPECCCPKPYNNERKIGAFYCPRNAFHDTAGPYADKLTSLNMFLTNDVAVDAYPYCPTLAEDQDELHCSLNFNASKGTGVDRFYSYKCPPLQTEAEALQANAAQATTDNATAAAAGRTSPFLYGEAYRGQCFYYDSCGAHPGRGGAYGEGPFESAETVNYGCPYECIDGKCPRDVYFSFIGQVGKITCVPTEEAACITYDGDKFEDDSVYYLVSFNDGRTSYPFRSTDLQLHRSVHNYQLWWVQRTRSNFIIQKKKGFKVAHPTCTFDAVNDRYFPYTIVNDDGSYIDTFYG